MDESNDPEVGRACGEVGIVHRCHEKRRQAGDSIAQLAHRLESVGPRQLGGDQGEIDATTAPDQRVNYAIDIFAARKGERRYTGIGTPPS